MGKRKKNISAGQEPDPSAWLVTFGDLVMLLLTFFVMLLTMSSIDTKKLKDTFSHFREAPPVLELAASRKIKDLDSFVRKYQNSDGLFVLDQGVVKKLLIPSYKADKNTEAKIKEFYEKINISDDRRGIVLSFQGDILFAPGGAALKKEVFPFLDLISETIESCPNKILITGHTDNIPIRSRLYGSNWELSLYRGLSVLKYFLLEKGLSPSRFSVGGYGASRPLHPNDTPEKRALNRRVEIIFKHL
ncbi:MAG: flagellar motor protein MotB [Deltaproteobacteria bacterium]|nr:flagellar motor protein MotB [Deltaproteobacteria bacterium]